MGHTVNECSRRRDGGSTVVQGIAPNSNLNSTVPLWANVQGIQEKDYVNNYPQWTFNGGSKKK
jgi:hypothetical protein